ncbi:MAG: nitroreductase family protein, partial [Thermoproteota archaeon]
MDTFECISKRRSVRSFLKKPVPKELVNRVLEAAL